MTHPLEPLSATEIQDAVAIFRQAHADEHAVFCSSGLEEPTKSLVKAGAPTDRVVRLLGTDSVSDGGFEALVNLTKQQIDRLDRLPSEAQAPYGYKDLGLAIHLTKNHAQWLDAVKARGIRCDTDEDLARIQIDPWPAGGYPVDQLPKGHRAVRCIAFLREDATDNGYARPIHGLICHVDVTDQKVIFVEDSGVIPMPPNPGRFDSAHQERTRTDLKDLEIVQPDGPSFEVDGYQVKWQGYEFSVSIHPVHGLVLH